MNEITLLSWNVNGIRALSKKEIFKNQKFNTWLQQYKPHILCLQETKAHLEQLKPALRNPQGYHSYWTKPERKGYSGVATYTRAEPQRVNKKLGINSFDNEGRLIETEFKNFVLFNVYFPNGKRSKERLSYKLKFYDVFLEYIDKLKKKGKSIIVCGDVNTAHNEIDLARPKENENISGFLPVERAWIDKLLDHGYVDTFRHFHPEKIKYSWWSYRTRARERNVGWRLDYFIVSEGLIDKVTKAFILDDIYGSDHCPVGLKIDLS